MPKKFIVGLGNPGQKYENTRHNVGFLFVEFLAMNGSFEPAKLTHQSLAARKKVDLNDLFLIMPQTFMNASGQSLLEWKRREGLSAENLLVVYDDMDLEAGRIRYRAAGSGGSHNGMASIIECLGTQEFARLRLGIGRPQDPALWADYVLKKIPKSENEQFAGAFEKGKQAVELWLQGEESGTIMSKVNGKPE